MAVASGGLFSFRQGFDLASFKHRGSGARPALLAPGGQLGVALAEVFPGADARTRSELDVTQPVAVEPRPDLVLDAAAWTNVDGAEEMPSGFA